MSTSPRINVVVVNAEDSEVAVYVDGIRVHATVEIIDVMDMSTDRADAVVKHYGFDGTGRVGDTFPGEYDPYAFDGVGAEEEEEDQAEENESPATSPYLFRVDDRVVIEFPGEPRRFGKVHGRDGDFFFVIPDGWDRPHTAHGRFLTAEGWARP